MHGRLLILYCIILWGMPGMAQHPCGLSDTTPVKGAIFGPDRLLVTGRDTLPAPGQHRLIYSCVDGQITCFNSTNKLLWTALLPKRLILFKLFYKGTGKKIKGCDVLLQYDDNSLAALNSKNGRLKPVSMRDVILSLPKVKAAKP